MHHAGYLPRSRGGAPRAFAFGGATAAFRSPARPRAASRRIRTRVRGAASRSRRRGGCDGGASSCLAEGVARWHPPEELEPIALTGWRTRRHLVEGHLAMTTRRAATAQCARKSYDGRAGNEPRPLEVGFEALNAPCVSGTWRLSRSRARRRRGAAEARCPHRERARIATRHDDSKKSASYAPSAAQIAARLASRRARFQANAPPEVSPLASGGIERGSVGRVSVVGCAACAHGPNDNG